MSGNGILMYDLAGNWCEECGRAKSLRMWLGTLTGCKTCDEVITRHRCLGRPALENLEVGESWECRLCGSVWTVTEVEDDCPECCADCGHKVRVRRWAVTTGDRIGSAPRYRPEPYAPFRDALRQMAGTLLARPAVSPAHGRYPRVPPGSCYVMASGSKVHVKPGCRC